jgi:flagellar hook-associated protein 1 FlgK
MGGISSAMISTAEAMRVIQRQVSVAQNNIVNASTPNYARLDQATMANRFNPNMDSSSGGISAAPLISGRDRFLEGAVWERQSSNGYSEQSLQNLKGMEAALPVAADRGIPAAMEKFYSSAAQLALTPNSDLSRQAVLDRARSAARSFNEAANEFGALTARAGTELGYAVRDINTVAQEIAAINQQRKQDSRTVTDAGLDSRLHEALEKLSTLVDHNTLMQEDGSAVVFVAGQVPLVVGDQAYPLTTTIDNGQYQIIDSRGENMTSAITRGRLGALLEMRNTTMPQYSAQVDTLARGFADQVNGILAGGLAANGLPPVQNLFTYDAVAGAAATLAVTGMTTGELAAAGAGEPGGNANANRLAQLSNKPAINGLTLTGYYGAMATTLGARLESTRGRNTSDQQLLLQARTLRQQVSGVSVDQEAAKLLEYQRGFQAVGQVMGVLNEMTDTLFGIMN